MAIVEYSVSVQVSVEVTVQVSVTVVVVGGRMARAVPRTARKGRSKEKTFMMGN